MFDFDFPPVVKGEILDSYLAKGWFRIGSILHTTDSVEIGCGEIHPAFWLRYKVNAVRLRKKNTKLILTNSAFTTACRTLELNRETARLFKKYRRGIPFKINKTLESILTDATTDTFDSRILEVRDNGRLIAAGIFDTGKNSIENIINFYDHDYSQHSLGKFLMVSIYRYCLENGYEYYYPGYFLPGHEAMSYKLFLDKMATEVYIPEQNQWVSFHEFFDYKIG
jgi:arginyl-tRNA--protein-N-Asp/Glu arginylyltransferase